MKRLLLIALLGILSYTTFAQAGSLTVTNNSNCTVYYVIRGDKVGTCGFNVASSMLTLPPGGVIVYPNSAAIPGFPPAPLLWITVANIYPRPASCGAPDIFSVGEPCSGFPPTVTYPDYDQNCQMCNPMENALWIPASSPGAMATLKFF